MRDIERPSFDEDVLHAQVAIQHHHVRPGAGGQAAAVAELQEIRRVGGQAARRVVQRQPTTSTRLRSARSMVSVEPASVPSAEAHAAQALGDGLAPEPVLASRACRWRRSNR
jgi:hypothetical protein